MPKYTEKTLEEILDNRLQEIITRYDGGKIAVAWSGGVDSTAVVCGLIKNGVSPKNISLTFKQSSIEENPDFLEFCKNLGCEISHQRRNFIKAAELTNPDVYLNGNCADQLYGSIIHIRAPEAYMMSPTDGLRTHFEQIQYPISETTLDLLTLMWKRYCSRFGHELKTFSQLAMLYNIACKWDYVKEEFKFLTYMNPVLKGKDIAVFGTSEFTDWAFSNFERNTLSDQWSNPAEYKKDLKNYIMSVFPAYEKYIDRGKKFSIPHPIYYASKSFVLMDDNSVIVHRLTETRSEQSRLEELRKIQALYEKQNV